MENEQLEKKDERVIDNSKQSEQSEQKEIVEKKESIDRETEIETHTLETDMAKLGIGVDEKESIEDDKLQKEDKVEESTEKKEEPKKLTRKERRIQRIVNENKSLKDRIAELEAKQNVKADVELDIDDFESYDEYVAALEKQEVKTENEPPSVPKIDIAKQQAMFEDGLEDYENFEELVTAPDLALTPDMLNIILDSDNNSDVVYYLATHKDVSSDIAQMEPIKMAKALAKIELKLETKEKKTVQTTNAPEPISPVSGGNSAVSKSLNDPNLSFEEHEALLNRTRTNNAGGFL